MEYFRILLFVKELVMKVFVRYNLVFLLNIGPRLFFAMSGKLVQCWSLQQPVVIQKLTASKQKPPESAVIQLIFHWAFSYVWSLLGKIPQDFCLCDVVLRHGLQKYKVRKHFRYLTNMLKIRSRGFDCAQYCDVVKFRARLHETRSKVRLV